MSTPAPQPPRFDWPAWALAGAHRAAILAILLLAGVVVAVVQVRPTIAVFSSNDPSLWRAVDPAMAQKLAWLAIILADAAILIAAVALVRAFRHAEPIRQSAGLILFSLAMIHLLGWLMLTNFDVLLSVRAYLYTHGILQPQA